jgi:hypothetical protein
MRPATASATLLLLLSPATLSARELDASEVVARHVEARGGAERWRALTTLELTGIYAAFSFREPFRLIRKRGDRYRLDYVVLGKPATRARDDEGPWGQHPLLQPEAAHITEDPYKSQLERESLFGPLLLDYQSRGITVTLIGEGEVEGQATVDLRLAFPGGAEEIWHLDPESWLEVAVDTQIWDYTQGTEPIRRRTFFDDFREVEGLVLPFRVEHQFGARLEAMMVEKVGVDPQLDAAAFAAPPAPKPTADGESPAPDERAGEPEP